MCRWPGLCSMNIITSIMNDITICMAYEENTSISENSCALSARTALSIMTAPMKYTDSTSMLLTSVIDGIMVDMTLAVNTFALVSSSFTDSNLSCW